MTSVNIPHGIRPLFAEAIVKAVNERYSNLIKPFDPNSFELQAKNVHIGEELAKGAFGTVFKATLDNVAVVVKSECISSYRTGELVNLLSELTFLQSTTNEHIVKFIGAGFVMEKEGTKVRSRVCLFLNRF